TAERTACGIAATPGRAVEAPEANRPVRASPRAPPTGPLGPPDRTRTGPGAADRVPLPAAPDVPSLGPRGVAPVSVGPLPGVDRPRARRGFHERRRVARAVDRTRLQRVVRRRLRVRHEAARRRREAARAPQRGPAAGPGTAVSKAALLRVGPPRGETEAC